MSQMSIIERSGTIFTTDGVAAAIETSVLCVCRPVNLELVLCNVNADNRVRRGDGHEQRKISRGAVDSL